VYGFYYGKEIPELIDLQDNRSALSQMKKPQPKAKACVKKTNCLKKGPAAKKKASPKGS
jgi:hypothetical protein